MNSVLIRFHALIYCLVVCACSEKPPEARYSPPIGVVLSGSVGLEELRYIGATNRVPLVRVVAMPERFDGRTFSTFGYTVVGREFSILCSQPRAASYADCLYIEMSAELWEGKEGKPVELIGTFIADDPSRRPLAAGTFRVLDAKTLPERYHGAP